MNDPSSDQQELTLLRREMDRVKQDRLIHIENQLDDLNQWVRAELSMLDQRIDAKLIHEEILLTEKAASKAVKQAFSHLGVDVDDPADLQQFRDDLRFGGLFRAAAAKSFFALIAAIFGGIGLSLWLTFKDQLGFK